MSKQISISFKLNGGLATVTTPPAISLQHVLREGLRLTGTKNGCGEGECGACTVLIDGFAVNACLVPVCQVEGRSVLTIEAFDGGDDGVTHPLLTAMETAGAVQCGFCTPGMIMSAAGLLCRNPGPTMDAIREALAGNLCRCTGYSKIFKAVQSARTDFYLPNPPYREYRCEIREIDPLDIIPLKHLDEIENLGVLDSWDMRFLAGGTDLMVMKNQHNRQRAGDVWIDLSQCHELRGISIADGRLHIGSGVTWMDLIHDPHIRQYAPALATAARQVGSCQIRARGTIGGNLGNASPAADSYPVLAALGADVETVSPDGKRRRIPVEKLAIRPGKTCLQAAECIVEVSLPVQSGVVSGFFKSVPRCAQALAKVSVAIAFKMDGGRILQPRIALGAVGPTTLRVDNAEQFMDNRPIDSPGIDDIVSASLEAAAPIDDFRATRSYRIRMIEVGIRRIMNELLPGGRA